MKKWITSKGTTIFLLRTMSSNCYLIEKNGNYILVDTGTELEYLAVLRQLRKIGVRQLAAIFITHVHADHVGNAKRLQNKYDCQIFANQLEYNWLTKGFCEMPEASNAFMHFLAPKLEKTNFFSKFLPCGDVKTYRGNCMPEGFEQAITICATPGHTIGSTTILVDNEIAIIGDCMVNWMWGNYPPFVASRDALLHSWKELLRAKCTCYLPGHGKELTQKNIYRALRGEKRSNHIR